MDGLGVELGWWWDVGINVGLDYEFKLGVDIVWGE